MSDNKKKHKKKKAKTAGKFALLGAIGTIVSEALGKILVDAVEVATDRLSDAQEKASRAIKRKKRDVVAAAQAVAP